MGWDRCSVSVLDRRHRESLRMVDGNRHTLAPMERFQSPHGYGHCRVHVLVVRLVLADGAAFLADA